MNMQSQWLTSSTSAQVLSNEKFLKILNLLDANSQDHSLRVHDIALKLGWFLNIKGDKLVKLGIAALFHDIGKAIIDREILSKKSRLTRQEYQLIRRHPEIGAHIWMRTDGDKDVARIILCHHEHYDGNGYPNRLSGQLIPMEARIIAVADALDAMLSFRSYRIPLSSEGAIAVLRENSGGQFDPFVVNVVLRLCDNLFRIYSLY